MKIRRPSCDVIGIQTTPAVATSRRAVTPYVSRVSRAWQSGDTTPMAAGHHRARRRVPCRGEGVSRSLLPFFISTLDPHFPSPSRLTPHAHTIRLSTDSFGRVWKKEKIGGRGIPPLPRPAPPTIRSPHTYTLLCILFASNFIHLTDVSLIQPFNLILCKYYIFAVRRHHRVGHKGQVKTRPFARVYL